VVCYAERFNCSVNDLIYGRLPIIIYLYARNSVEKTTLDRLAFLRELIMITDGSLTLLGLLSSDELNDVISYVCTSFLVCLCSCYILYFMYDLIINHYCR